ncbi:stalk domain-containing protein [Anaerobacillus alkaliphilus]|nr:stalk domain-containing protein [Anaerobacillus alkaliphilus]
MKKYILVLIMVVVSIIGQGAEVSANDQTLSFPDPNLERAIRIQLKMPEGPITKEDVEKVTELNIEGSTDTLEGIQHLQNVKTLIINHSISQEDLKLVVGLKKINHLSIDTRRISDLQLLHELPKLQKLSIYGSEVRDLAPVLNLSGIESLTLAAIPLSDLGFLVQMDLRELVLVGNGLEDLKGIEQLASLEGVSIWHNPIKDFTPLEELPNLQQLLLYDYELRGNLDLNQISKLTTLRSLSLVFMGIKDIRPLASLVHLEELDVSQNSIRNLSPLASLTNLKNLNLSSNFIQDINDLRLLRELTVLDISSNSISNITVLKELQELQYLKFSYNRVESIDPLKYLLNLETIYADSNNIRILTPLNTLPSLKTVFIFNNPLSGKETVEMIKRLQQNGVAFWHSKIYLQTEMMFWLNQPSWLLNGKNAVLDHPPYLKNNRTLVPIRVISEAFGAHVHWDPNAKTVTIKNGGNTIVLTVNDQHVLVNGQKRLIDVAPEINNGRTFVPIRFVSEQFGAKVNYQASSRSIIIEK